MKPKKVFLTFLIALIVILSSLIVEKKQPKSKFAFNQIKENLTSNMNVLKFAKVYNGLLGNIFPIHTLGEVSFEVDSYLSVNKYLNGVLLASEQEAVKTHVSGVVVFKGKKDNLGNVIIIKAEDDKEYYYGYLASSHVKVYQFVEKDSVIGIGKFDEDKYVSYFAIKDENFIDVLSYYAN